MTDLAGPPSPSEVGPVAYAGRAPGLARWVAGSRMPMPGVSCAQKPPLDLEASVSAQIYDFANVSNSRRFS